MKPQAADGAALVAAAVQAAIQAGAPRRTVAAVAAAVAGTALSAAARPTPSATRAREPPLDPQSAAEETGDPAQLLASLRASRRAQRLRKKQRRREAKTSTAVPLIAESAAASPGNTDTKNCEQQHHGGHGVDMPSAAARGSQDAEASTAAVQLVQIASEAPELIMPVDLPAPKPQSDVEDHDNRSLPDSLCSEIMTERDRQVMDEALAAIAALPDLGGTQSQQQPESAEELFQTAALKRRGHTAGRPNARALTSGRR